MANIVNGKYGLIEPGDGITAISMEGGEINLFGNSCTLIKMSAIDLFPQVKDINLKSKDPVEEKEEDFTEDEVLTGSVVTGVLAGLAIGGVLLAPVTGGASLWITFSAGTAAFGSGLNTYEMEKNSSETEEDPAADVLLSGSATTSVLAGIAIAGVLAAPVTGGASLTLTAFCGSAAVGTGLTTSGMVRNSRETGYQPDASEIAENLILGGCVGVMTGAFILNVIAAVPAFAAATGIAVSMKLGTSVLTTSVIPPIVKMGGYGIAFLNGVFTANGIYSNNAGHNVVLEKVFKDNVVAYESFGEILALIGMGIITSGTANSGLVLKKEKEGVYIEESGTETSRPTWRQSELDAAKDFPDYDAQKSFIKGEEVPYGTKGSVRPDYYKDGYSVDIKNYNVESASGRSNLARNIEKQYYQRIENLPEGTNQSVVIDIRGQNVTDADLSALYDDIMKRTGNGVEVLFKMD